MQQDVVGAAIVLDGKVLAARRSAPAELAGMWEFPGGKLEAGESDADALVREIREELGIEIAVGELIGSSDIEPGVQLRVYLAEHLLGFPEPRDCHDETRWLAVHDLRSVAWLPADLPLIGLVAGRVRTAP